jgi:translation initiation factor 1
MKSNRKNNNIVYSTNPDYQFEEEEKQAEETLAPQYQKLYVSLDKKQRKGKKVTLVTGFIGSEEDLKTLGKKLKTSCGAGGSTKEGMIIIQGVFREKVKYLLEKEAYKVKLAGG